MLLKPKILSELGFPQSGEILSGHEVVSIDHKFIDGQFKYQIKFSKEVKRADIPNILRMFFSKQLLNLEDGDYVVQAHDYSIKVGVKNTVVTGTISVTPVANANPAKIELTPMEDFNQEYSKMEIEKPESFFRKHTYGGFNTAQFRDKLFGFVSMMGENYGYCDKDHLYHRRASLIMPQIKITKAIPNAKMFYHTHPKKDEPSLSSPEDYLLYFDLSHEPRNIRHCFTVMKDRIDYFQVSPKKDKKGDYVKIDEDKIIAEIDAKMDEIQSKLDETMPSETMADNLEFCEKVTRETVKWLNKKYKTYFKIKYKCYYRVKKNPDDTDATSLHLDNEFLMKAINDIKAGEYTWPKFGSEELPHEQYAYWNSQFYSMVQGFPVRSGHFGLQPGDLRRLDYFLDLEIEGTKFTYYDVLNILTVSHDVNKQDESNRDGGGYVTRIPELLDYIGIEGDLNENIIAVEKILHEDPYSDAAKGFGEYIVPVLLAHYSIQMTEMMSKAKADEANMEQIKIAVYHPFRVKLMKHLSESMGELSRKLREERIPVPVVQPGGEIAMVPHGINPPPDLKKTDFHATVPTSIFDDGEFLAGILSEFDPRKHGFDKDLHGSTGWNLKYITDDNRVSFLLKTTGTMQIFASGEGNHEQAALNAYGKLIDVLTINGLIDKKDPIAQGLDKAVFDNPPMTGEQVIDAIDQENFFGGGAFGFVFTIPGTRYLLKIENDWPIEKVDTKYFTALSKYLYSYFSDDISKPHNAQGKWSKKPIPKPDYPFKGTLKKMHFGIENTRAGQPLYLVDDRYFIIDKIAGYPVDKKIPYLFKSNKKYTKKSMKEYYDHIEEMANLPQESWDDFVADIKLLTSKGLQHDVHSGNIIYNKSKKKLFLIDWWWGTKQSRHTAPSNVQPPFVQLVERTTMMMWISQMVNIFVDVAAYPDDEGMKKYKKELDYFYKREPKANEHRLTVYGKVDKAFRNNNFPRNKSNIADSQLLALMKEGEKYPDLFKRYLSLPLTQPRPLGQKARGGAGPLADPKTWPVLGSPYYMENPPKIESVAQMVLTSDRIELLKHYDRRVKSFFRSMKRDPKSTSGKRTAELLKILREEYKWKGRTGASLFEAIAKQIDSEIDSTSSIKLYRAAFMMPVSQENMKKGFKRFGLGRAWSSYKEGADNYVMNAGKFGYDYMYGAKQVLMEGLVDLSVVDWYNTFWNRLAWPKEREFTLFDEVLLKKVSIWDIDDQAREQYLKWDTTGKNWKPWVDPKFKPEIVYKFNEFFPILDEEESQPVMVPQDNPEEQHEDSIIYGVMENPPAFEFSRDKAKRKKRWEFITTSAPHELYDKANEMADEKGAYFEVKEEGRSRPEIRNIPANIEKDFLEWYYTHTKKIMFHLSVKGKQVASLERTVYQKPMPKSIYEFVQNYKTKHRNWEKGPLIRGFLSYRTHSKNLFLNDLYYPLKYFGPDSPPMAAYPLMIDAGGGHVKKGKRFQGYYAILKMLEAAYMENNGIEGYGEGASLQRAEYFRSFGWLMPQDMKYAPYVHKGPRTYLDLVDDKAGWDSVPQYLWRPVYSKTKKNPSMSPIEKEARRAATDPSFKHHKWYSEHHLEYMMAIMKRMPRVMGDWNEEMIDMVWMHDYPKMMGDNDNFELVRELLSKHKGQKYADDVVHQIKLMERMKEPDWDSENEYSMIAANLSTADALSHYYGPFFQIHMDENPNLSLDELKQRNQAKLEKDKLKLRAGPKKDALDSIRFQYKDSKVRIVGNDHIKELIERKNPFSKMHNGMKISHYPDPDPESPKGMRRIDLHKDGNNIGFLLWIKKDGKIWLHYINVDKKHRGQDLGRVLIDELLSVVKGKEVHLHAPIGTSRAYLVGWYESMGFKMLEGDTNEMVLQNPSTRPPEPARKAGLYPWSKNRQAEFKAKKPAMYALLAPEGFFGLLIHDQAWVQVPHHRKHDDKGNLYLHPVDNGVFIEVDVMMKPLIEEMWRRGIDTHFSDTGGNLEPYPFDADEVRKKAPNAIPMGEYALEERWKEFESQTGDLGTEGNIDDKDGYLWFGEHGTVPSEVPEDFITKGSTSIRWAAAKDYANLRRLYAAFNVPFPDVSKNPPLIERNNLRPLWNRAVGRNNPHDSSFGGKNDFKQGIQEVQNMMMRTATQGAIRTVYEHAKDGRHSDVLPKFNDLARELDLSHYELAKLMEEEYLYSEQRIASKFEGDSRIPIIVYGPDSDIISRGIKMDVEEGLRSPPPSHIVITRDVTVNKKTGSVNWDDGRIATFNVPYKKLRFSKMLGYDDELEPYSVRVFVDGKEVTAMENPGWQGRHGEALDPEDDPFSDMFDE